MSRILARERATPTTLFVALPHDPSGSDGQAHWWRVTNDAVEGGVGGEWTAIVSENRPRVIGLAPPALVRLAFSSVMEGTASPRQAETIARVGALENSLGEAATLHTASIPLWDEPSTLVTAVAANSKMQEWLDWAEGLAVEIDHIVPAAMVLPLNEDWSAAQIGGERIVGRRGTVLPDEPALRDALLSAVDDVVEMRPEAIDLALMRLAAAPRPDLRTGRFARRRRFVIDRIKVRELASLALAIIFVSTVIVAVEVLKLNASRSALDSETLQIARTAAGPGITLDTAEAALAARAGPAGGSLSSGVAAVLARLQPEQNVSMSALGYSGGTLNFTVSGQGPDAINRVLLALQRDGYRVSAVPRTQSDGRTLAEVTLRNEP